MVSLTPQVGGSSSRILIDSYSSIYNMHMYWTKQKPEILARFIEDNCPTDGTVLDPFCGSGMTGVAARMTQRNAVLSDLSPMCCFLASNFTRNCSVSELKQLFKAICEEIESTYSWLYKTSCGVCDNRNARVHAVIWADNFQCPQCLHIQNLCDSDEHLKLTKGDTIVKLVCNQCQIPYKKTMRNFAASKPVFIEADCSSCAQIGKDNSRRLNERDSRWMKRIESCEISGNLPTSFRFPDGVNTQRCLQRKITHPYMLFSKMNLIYLSAYWKATDQRLEYGDISKVMRDKLRFIATSTMFHASLMRRWLPYRSGVPLKGTLFVPSIIEDINFAKVLKHKSKSIFKGQIAVNRLPKSKIEIHCRSALSLSKVKDGSIDYVLFDPPFGGHINYSELNLVWEAWIGKVTCTTDEILINSHQKKSKVTYSQMLRQALEVACRKLKLGGRITIVFAHSELETWRLLQDAVIGLPLKLRAHPVALDSKNKTFVQVYSSKAQQSMIAFTFAKERQIMGALKGNFITSAIKEIDKIAKAKKGGVSRDRLYDHIIQKFFSKTSFEDVDFDSLLHSTLRDSDAQLK